MDSTTASVTFDINNLKALKSGINELLDVFVEIAGKEPRDERYMHTNIQKKLKTVVCITDRLVFDLSLK